MGGRASCSDCSQDRREAKGLKNYNQTLEAFGVQAEEGKGRFTVQRLHAFGYVAGKYFLVDKLLSLIPSHSRYIEVFGGSMVLLLNKAPVRLEVYNDIQADLVNTFYAIKKNTCRIVTELLMLPYSRLVLKQVMQFLKNHPFKFSLDEGPDYKRAALYLYSQVFSYNASGSFSVRYDKSLDLERIGMINRLEVVSQRLAHVLLENLPFQRLIERYDSEGAFFFLDPPYFEKGQSQGGNIFWKLEQHKELREILGKVKGKWLLTYDNSKTVKELYSDYPQQVETIISHGSKNNPQGKHTTIQHLIIRNYCL
jgi:DNA adenine methylase